MKLCIVFPTYNRAAYLRRAVLSVLAQRASLPAGHAISLRIHDNQSTDDTQNVCAELQAVVPDIVVVRHPVNIGGDANILSGLQAADGDYVWIFGDDDHLHGGALAPLCDLLEREFPDIVKLELVEERKGTSETVAPLIGTVEGGSLPIQRFDRADAILARFELGMGNFTSTIFATRFFNAHYQPADEMLFASGYSQLAWIYAGLQRSFNGFVYIPLPLVSVRVEISPRHVSADNVTRGLELLYRYLEDLGYPHATVAAFRRNQSDAILLGRVKTCKMVGGPLWKEVIQGVQGLSGLKQRFKLLIIAALPSQLYRYLWGQL